MFQDLTVCDVMCKVAFKAISFDIGYPGVPGHSHKSPNHSYVKPLYETGTI